MKAEEPDTKPADKLLSFIIAANTQLHDAALDISFEGISLAISNGSDVLKNVSGCNKPCRLTAIMGACGAGKTCLLHCLMGKVPFTCGSANIGGVAEDLAKFRSIVGYVPQDDVMHRMLTVRENITHSARCRLPRDWSSSQLHDFVFTIIAVLHLSNVEDSFIGDSVVRGISGGERKRTNIGMELAAAPVLLFLDEPLRAWIVLARFLFVKCSRASPN